MRRALAIDTTTSSNIPRARELVHIRAHFRVVGLGPGCDDVIVVCHVEQVVGRVRRVVSGLSPRHGLSVNG